jgi:predicted short-subunit dehydrogenase-like oxidoreductase (DUF2520 family)
MKIAVIGSGNIATFFSLQMHQAGLEIIQIVSKTELHAKELATYFNCAYTDNINELNQNADVYLFAVRDDILLDFAKTIKLHGKLVVHTAGSITLDNLSTMSNTRACIWCMYSIQKKVFPTQQNIPLIVNATDNLSLERVSALARSISSTIYLLPDQQKSMAHLAAVFANNFTNHLFALAQQLLEKENIPFELLIPIIQNTVDKLSISLPINNQTGPAIRHDEKTIEAHIQILANTPKLSAIYQLLTGSIQEEYSNKK